MLQIGIMLLIAAAAFWWLHLYLAIAVGVVIALSGSWMLRKMTDFTIELMTRIPDLL